MTTIKITTIRKTANGYIVPIGKHDSPEFTQLRQAKAYTVKVSKHLTDCLYKINEYYKQVVSLSQSYVFSLSLKEMKDYADQKYAYDNKLIYLSSRKPDTVFVVNGILNVCSMCVKICNTISSSVGKKMKYTGSDTAIEVIHESLLRIYTEVTTYPPTDDDHVTNKTINQLEYRAMLMAV